MFIKKIACLIALASTFCIAGTANASLIQNGDGTFTDTTTGYAWQNIGSFWGVNVSEMNSHLLAGFEFASLSQVQQLQNDAPALPENYFADAAAMGVPHSTSYNRDLIWGVYGDLTNYTWKYSNDSQWNFYPNDVSSYPDLGAFAVNTNVSAVPEPTSVALLGLGLAGLALRRRRKAD